MNSSLGNAEYIYINYYNRLKYFFQKSGISPETAEELSQDTIVKVYSNHDKYQETLGKESSWIYAIARNEMINYFRKTKKEELYIDNQANELIFNSYSKVLLEEDKDETLNALRTAIKELKEPEKSIILLHCIQGKTIAETAKYTGISQRTISRRLVSALILLKDDLKSKGINKEILAGLTE
ncbi:MAG: sigma-70 family RNA polymerase sigma factor [Leptospira sp.]|nr:sigma-70 family RNA polymerase sigma factor [Leptospira sp.]